MHETCSPWQIDQAGRPARREDKHAASLFPPSVRSQIYISSRLDFVGFTTKGKGNRKIAFFCERYIVELLAAVNMIFVEDHYYFAQLWSMFYTPQRLSLYMYNDNNQTRPTCLV